MMKFGIILQQTHIDDWQYRIIQDTQRHSSKLELVVSARIPARRESTFSTCLYETWEKSQLKKAPSKPMDFLSSPIAANVPVITCDATKASADVACIDEQTADKIRLYGLDFILYFGPGTLSGAILNAARLGVWSFHFGNEKKYRSHSSCFWEMYNQETEIEGVLQCMTGTPGSSTVLQRFSVPNHKYSLATNIKALREASIPMVSCAVVDVVNGIADPHDISDETPAETRAPPTNREMIRFLCLITLNLIKIIAKRAFFSHHWQMALTDTPVDEVMTQGIKKSCVIKRGRIHDFFYADPFIFAESTGNISIFSEKFDWDTGLGTIVKIDAATQGNDIREEKVVSILEMPVHLAYPSIIRAEGKTYLLPEAKKSGRIALHEIDAQGVILGSTTIVDNVELNDPTLVFHNSKYWLFGSTLKGELYIWHSNKLTEGWRPHAKQPVLISPSRSRAAGAIFWHNNQLVRPTQDCSEHYGKQVIFNKITTLDENSFCQQLVGTIPPVTNGVSYDGLHTFNIGQSHIIFDLQSWHLDLLKPARIILKTARNRLGTKLRNRHAPSSAETTFRNASGDASAAVNKS